MAAILIVDDEPSVAQSMQRALQTEHQVELSTDASASLETLRQGQRYGAILCDLSMPGYSGLEFFDEVRALDPAQAQRIIFVSGGVYQDDMQDRLALLTNPRLDKPFSLEQIRQIVRRVAA